MNANSDHLRFDRRLVSRNLREGKIKLEDYQKHIDALEDISHLAILSPEDRDTSTSRDDLDSEDED